MKKTFDYYKLVLEASVVVLLSSMLVGCATKRHGRAVSLTPAEARHLDCKAIEIELDKNRGFMADVAREGGQLDGRALLGILGDLGIGNAMETSDAMNSAKKREEQLFALSRDKSCVINLAGVQAQGGALGAALGYSPTGFAAINDASKLPSGPGCQKHYADNYIRVWGEKAYALSGNQSSNGMPFCFSRTGAGAATRALDDCNKLAQERGLAACKLYAVNDQVVWQP